MVKKSQLITHDLAGEIAVSRFTKGYKLPTCLFSFVLVQWVAMLGCWLCVSICRPLRRPASRPRPARGPHVAEGVTCRRWRELASRRLDATDVPGTGYRGPSVGSFENLTWRQNKRKMSRPTLHNENTLSASIVALAVTLSTSAVRGIVDLDHLVSECRELRGEPALVV
jgi:hypothetical protein